MNDTKNILKIWSVIGILAAVFAVFSSLPHAKAAICLDCGGTGGGGGGTVTVPVAPTLNSVNAGSSGQVSVNFTDNSTNETGFYVYRGTTLVGTLAAITATGTTSVFTDTGMGCGATYSYYVQAYNSAGGANSATLSVAVKCPPTPVTINSYGATSQTAVSYTWTTTSNIDYSWVFRDYVIYGSAPQNAVTSTQFTSVDTGLACGSTHTYFVRVGNGMNTADSVSFNITTLPCSPPAPTLNSVTSASQNQINVTFYNNSTAAFGQVGFYVYRDGVAIAPTGFGVNPTASYVFSDTGVACGTSHSYYVEARNNGGSTFSGTLSGSSMACVSAPAAVASPVATPVPGNPSINSSWTGTFDGVRVYLKGPTGYSLAGDFASAIKATSFASLKCPYPYTAYYVAYNNDSSVSGTDASCSSALSNAGISGPAAPTGAKCASAVSKPVDMRFCTQQFLGN